MMFNPHGALRDMMQLWIKDAPWPQAKRKVQELILVHYWIRQTPIDQVREVVEFARRHHMKINLSVEAIRKYPTDHCGSQEGYTSPGELGAAAQILKNLNADVDLVEIDEPLWFGSYSTDPVDCQLSVQETVQRTALNMAEVLAVFPHIKISEIEPIPAIVNIPTWKADLDSIEIGLSQSLGRRITFLQVDIGWPDPAWKSSLTSIRDFARERGIGLGIIYNGNPLTTSDQDWIDSAVQNMETIEGTMGIVPAMASFQTWDAYPVCNLPETASTAMTWWINRYVRKRSTIGAQFQGAGAFGRLTDFDGKPIANVTVNGFKPGVDFSRPMPVSILQGTVPPTAATAILAVRLNTECGGCGGMNDVLIGPLAYQEIMGGAVGFNYSVSASPVNQNGATFGTETVGGVAVTRVIAPPGAQLVLNSGQFSVTANAKYVFSVPAVTVAGNGWFGNVDIIWIDANGNGLPRLIYVPNQGKVTTSSAVTDADGRFILPKLPRAVDGPFPVSIEFDGAGGQWRSSVWTPLR